MRVVADTNIVISGLLWGGSPRQVLEAARQEIIDLFTSAVLLAELEDVLQSDKFALRLAKANVTPHELTLGYSALATIVEPAEVASVIIADPDDDAVLACAVAANAEVIVSGDHHLLELKRYFSITILSSSELLSRLSLQGNS
ncbi:MAG TPA: putative toxin-antitoxin system toxin component, PIN family [Blastocatellia bacterium]|nr:putative toxin-antitoxin system toxin component, PIN family [Blastocatellia bacterium]